MPNILTCVFYNNVQQNVTALCCAKAFIGTINLVAFFAALFHLFCFWFLFLFFPFSTLSLKLSITLISISNQALQRDSSFLSLVQK